MDNIENGGDSSISIHLESNPRYVRSLAKDAFALILAGGRGSRLHELTDWRAKPALFFGGKFRLVDYPLSNCINSGIRRVGVLTQYKSHSLVRHLVRGWTHFKRELGESVEILPASQRFGDDWYKGTADAVFQNLDIIRSEHPKYVIILSGDHVYRMDYAEILAEHVARGAKMTISCVEVSLEEARNEFGVIVVDADNRVIGFEEKPAEPTPIPQDKSLVMASMGNYVFDTNFLFEQLKIDAADQNSSHDFGKDIIPSIIADNFVYAHPFRDHRTQKRAYWRDVGTLDSYWLANMELVQPDPPLNMYDPEWPIWTYQSQLPPAKFVFDDDQRRGMAVDSLVSGGCIISGAKVSRTVLFSNVRLHSHSEIDQSILLPEVDIGRNCRIRKTIIDRGCKIPDGFTIGYDHELDRSRGFRVTDKGVVLVTLSMLGQREEF